MNGGMHKVGKADLVRVTKSSGLPTRLHQKVRKLENTYGKVMVSERQIDAILKLSAPKRYSHFIK